MKRLVEKLQTLVGAEPNLQASIPNNGDILVNLQIFIFSLLKSNNDFHLSRLITGKLNQSNTIICSL